MESFSPCQINSTFLSWFLMVCADYWRMLLLFKRLNMRFVGVVDFFILLNTFLVIKKMYLNFVFYIQKQNTNKNNIKHTSGHKLPVWPGNSTGYTRWSWCMWLRRTIWLDVLHFKAAVCVNSAPTLFLYQRKLFSPTFKSEPSCCSWGSACGWRKKRPYFGMRT